MEKQETTEKKEVSIRILQLKNNFYWNNEAKAKEALGEYCVLGYFDAMDITKADKAEVKDFYTWGHLGELTFKRKSTLSCRTLVCVTEQQEEDDAFWSDKTQILYFITMIRIKKNASAQDKWRELENKLPKSGNYINYLSYDHSEIIVVTKTNTFSEGSRSVRLIRKICDAVKTYTVFAVREDILQSYEEIQSKLHQEKVCCRLHCMVRNYERAEAFRNKLKDHFSSRHENADIVVRKYETFGGYDWLLEMDGVSISSVLECYRMGEMLTHSNEDYVAAFFNVESEILTEE